MLVEVLGPIRLRDRDGRDRTPDGPLRRRLLSLLVLHRGRVVSSDAASGALWPVERPKDPVAALHNHVSRLRAVLPDGSVESVGLGYRLDPASVEVDADRLVGVLGSDPERGRAVVDEIDGLLARWSGPAHPELDDLDDGRAEAARLDELRVRAREVRADAAIAAGEAAAVVPELVALVEAEPLREQPRALLMAALDATGRRVEALRVFDDFRRLVGDELGIEPSPDLVARHAELLAGDERVTGRVRARVPAPTTSLVGREALVDEVVELAGSCRSATLVGPAGVGKTRLAVEVANRLVASAPDRPVVVAELAGTDESTALAAVAAALGIDVRPGVPTGERIAQVVGDRELTLVLDNCEHVLAPVASFVDELLRSCPGACVLATSQERLRVPGEHVVVVEPLGVGAEDSPAVALFFERARAVAPRFDPEGADRERVVEIARRLDGLPLAIELAAARLHTLDVEEVAAGLDDRFQLLSNGYRSSVRHASLATAVSWSFDLLDPSRQQVLCDLSAFSGPFGVEAAAAVCGLPVDRMRRELAVLVERSLVRRGTDHRFVLLETLRAFGADQLEASGRADEVARRHARFHVEWVEDADRRLPGPQVEVLAEYDDALPELRVALGSLLARHELELAGRLMRGLLNYGFLRLRHDVLAWAEQVVAAAPDGGSPAATHAWVTSAYAAWMGGDVPEAERRAERALGASASQGLEVLPEVCTLQGSIELFLGRLDAAARWYRRSAESGSADRGAVLIGAASELLALGYAGDPAGPARAEQLLAEVGDVTSPFAAYAWYCAGESDLGVDVDRARARLTRARALAVTTRATFVEGLAGASLASLEARVGDPLRAAAQYRELIDHWRRAGAWATEWTVLRSIAGLLARLGRSRDAAVLAGAVLGPERGHRIFGADEEALRELETSLRTAMGAEAYERAREEGAVLDAEQAVGHALRSL